MNLAEEMISESLKKILNKNLVIYQNLKWQMLWKNMDDKPDLRNPLKLVELSDIFKQENSKCSQILQMTIIQELQRW